MRLRYKKLYLEEQAKRQDAEERLARWRTQVGSALRRDGRARWAALPAAHNGRITVTPLQHLALQMASASRACATADSWFDGHDDPQSGFVQLKYGQIPIIVDNG